MNQVPPIVGITYAVLSLIAFGVYAWHKSAATSDDCRSPEDSLHLLGLAGGWPGALIAQQTLRHKSKKVSFVIGLWATALINGGAFLWLQTEPGQSALQAFPTFAVAAVALGAGIAQ